MKKKKRGKTKKQNFDLKKEYKQCWDFIKKSKYFIWSIVIVFFAFAFIGYFVPAPDYLSESIMRFLEELIEKTQGMSSGQLISFIFLNNLESSFIGMVLGVFFGFFSILFALFNGYVLGFVSAMAVKAENIFVLLRLLPHGVFELPAIFLSLGLGIKLGSFVFKKNKLEAFKEYFSNCIKVFLLVIIPLLVLASIIEGLLMFFL